METLEKPPNTVMDDAILDALQRQPFSSVRELAKLTCIPGSTVHRYLTQTLGFVVKRRRCVPHSLPDPQKASRVFLANQLLGELRSVKHHDWELSVTLDESWFYLATNHEQLWLRFEEKPPKDLGIWSKIEK
jgi:hypothetical protein